MNRADLYNAFPDDLKQAIRAYEPLEQKSVDRLHDILVDIRYKLDLPPWHPFTEFIKAIAQGIPTNKSAPKPWVIRKRDPLIYTTNTKAKWVRITLIVAKTDNSTDRSVMQFAVSPKLNMVWAYSVEGPIKVTSIKVGDSTVMISKNLVMRYAREAIKKQRDGAKHDFIPVNHTVKAQGKRKQKQQEELVTLQDILTPDPEAPKAPKAQEPSITEADKEVLLTMLEIASIKLKELGMFSTLNRWRSTVRRLTKVNETDKTETAGTSDHLSGDA